MLKQLITLSLLSLCTGHAGQPYQTSTRETLNLAGDWSRAITDDIELQQIPSGLEWEAGAVPVDGLNRMTESADKGWIYCKTPPADYFDEEGGFKVQDNRSVWFKRTVTVDPALLERHSAFLEVGGMSYRSAVFVNGEYAGGSIQSTVPLQFDLTPFLEPGENEIVLAVTTREGLMDQTTQSYLAPSWGAMMGIRGPIYLEFKPKVSVEDVFVKTFVKDESIAFTIEVDNRTSGARLLKPYVTVWSERYPKEVLAEFSGETFTAEAGRRSLVGLEENWMAPILWTLDTPEIYVAEVALYEGDRLVDTYEQTFGFREFTAEGKDLMLNGKRVVLLRDSSLNRLKTVSSDPEELAITQMDPAVNTLRPHLGTNTRDILYRAERQGVMLMPEAAYSWVNIFPHTEEQTPVWLPGVLEYYRLWARHLRNNPAVVIYSLANETYWQRTEPEEMAVAEQIVEVMRENDPTRLLQGDGENSWGGLLDVINAHYPEGNAGTLRLEYPNSSLTIPNDFWWLNEEGGSAWRSTFEWDRPLIMGEFGPGLNKEQTSTGGDEVFNWVRWQMNKNGGRDFGAGDPNRGTYYFDVLRKWCDYYRNIGVAGLNPWAGEYSEMLKPMTVAPLDFHPNVKSGGVFKRDIVVLNDGDRPLNGIRYYWEMDGRILVEEPIDFYLAPGKKKNFTLEIPVPEVEEAKSAQLLVRLFWRRANKMIEVDRFEETVYVIPDLDRSEYTDRVAVVGGDENLDQLLASIGLGGAQRIDGEEISEATQLVLVAEDAFDASMAPALDAFVENGGMVLIMAQEDWRPFRSELPERDMDHAATKTWKRAVDHPVLKNIDDAQLSYWTKDNVITRGTYKKPEGSSARVLIDTGGRFGMVWTPLVEVPVSHGAYLMSTLELTKGEPVAAQLLANIVDYSVNFQAPTLVSLNVLSGENTALETVLNDSGVIWQSGIGGVGPVLVDASAHFEMGDLKAALSQDRRVWLHGFTPETLGKVSELLPQGASLKPRPKEILGSMPINQNTLTSGVTNFDMAWYIPKLYWRGPLFEGAKLVSNPGDWLLDINLQAPGVEVLSAPNFWVEIQQERGTVFFDTLHWEQAYQKMPSKVMRLVSTMFTNLNLRFESEDLVDYSYSGVDLSAPANMAYMDIEAGDGVGGWTDQGRNDMRFFLINHSGKGNGEENGMDVPVPDFPTKVEFDGIPFWLVDPQANGNKAILSFGSDKFGSNLMREAGPIEVSGKAHKLWLLHALGWANGMSGEPVAEYIVRYADGSLTTFPVKRFVDIGDWFMPSPYPNARVAWTGDNLVAGPVGIYIMPWENPYPEKELASIEIKAGLTDSQYVLVAITKGDAAE